MMVSSHKNAMARTGAFPPHFRVLAVRRPGRWPYASRTRNWQVQNVSGVGRAGNGVFLGLGKICGKNGLFRIELWRKM